MSRGALRRWALSLAFAGVLWAGDSTNPPLAIHVSSETAPAGSWTQLKIFLNPPASVSGGSIAMDLDPAIFGDIASVAVFSPNGDALGYANVSQQHVDAHFESSSAWLGAMPNLPVFVVDVPVLSTAPAGATTSVTLDAGGTSLSDAQGNPYSVSVTPGKFTVGGTLSITSITPAGGIVPAGDPFLQSSISVAGTGFDAGTTLAIDGVSTFPASYVSPGEIQAVVAAQTDLSGKELHVVNSSGEHVDYFCAFSSAPLAPPAGLTGYVEGVQPLVSLAAFQATTIAYDPVEPFTQMALLNQNPTAVDVAFLEPGFPTGMEILATIAMPPGALYLVSADVQAQFTPAGEVIVLASQPIGGLNYLAPLFAPTASVSFLQPQSTTNPPVIGGLAENVDWSWQTGTPLPAPQTLAYASGFTVSVPANAPWLEVSPLNSASAGQVSFSLTAGASALPPGTYTANVSITPVLSGAFSSLPVTADTVSVLLYVNAASGAQASRQPASARKIVVRPAGTAGAPSFTVDPASLTITLEAGTAPVDAGFGATITYPLELLVTPNLTAITLSVSTQSGGNWLTATLSPTPPSPRQDEVLVGVTAVGLAAGTWQGTVTIASPGNGTVQVPVTLIALPPFGPDAQLTVTPSSLSLSDSVPGLPAVNSTLSLGSTGNPIPFGVQATFGGLDTGLFDFGIGYSLQSSGGLDGSQPMTPATLQVFGSASEPGVHTGTIVFIGPNNSVTVPVSLTIPAAGSNWPPIMATIANAASHTVGAISPGEIIMILGLAIGPDPTNMQVDAMGRVTRNLGNTQVLINDVPAPLIYADATLINLIVPYETPTSGFATVKVITNGQQTAYWGVPVAPAAPGIFTLTETGLGQAAVLNADNTVNGPANPAVRGTPVQIFATGEGQTNPPGITGELTGLDLKKPLLPVKVTIGGIEATLNYFGSAPDAVAGLFQVNAMMPAGVTPGPAVPVVLMVGDARSPDGVTIAVK
ncbi:MAG: hypothetical protein ABSF98_14310 [Bryobacteraceae bacterium]